MYDEFATNSELIICPFREMFDAALTTAEPDLQVRTPGSHK